MRMSAMPASALKSPRPRAAQPTPAPRSVRLPPAPWQRAQLAAKTVLPRSEVILPARPWHQPHAGDADALGRPCRASAYSEEGLHLAPSGGIHAVQAADEQPLIRSVSVTTVSSANSSPPPSRHRARRRASARRRGAGRRARCRQSASPGPRRAGRCGAASPARSASPRDEVVLRPAGSLSGAVGVPVGRAPEPIPAPRPASAAVTATAATTIASLPVVIIVNLPHRFRRW